jgi:hypothetical protein
VHASVGTDRLGGEETEAESGVSHGGVVALCSLVFYSMGGGTASDPDGSVPDRQLAQAALATKHHEPTLGSGATGRFAACQLVCIVGTHSENTASGEHCGQGEKVGRHSGKRGGLTSRIVAQQRPVVKPGADPPR